MLEHDYSFEALGTQWEIHTKQQIPLAIKKKIVQIIDDFDKVYSRFRDDSLITQIAQKPGSYLFPDTVEKMIPFYKSLYDLTNGKVTPLIGNMLVRAGYDASYSFKPRKQGILPTWDEAMAWDGRWLYTNQPMTLDFGAAGKGYLVDIIAQFLDKHAIHEFIINASGDLIHKGTTKNVIGLEHPLDTEKVIGSVEVENASLCASANNRRAWGDQHHIFDPETQAPTKEVIASWVIAKQAMVADGLATAVFFVDPDILRRAYKFEFVRIFNDGTLEYSPFFEGKLF